MTNAWVSKFCILHQTAVSPLLTRCNLVGRLFRSFSSCSSVDVASACPSTISHSSLTPTAQLSAANITQRSDEWFALRRDKLTASTFSAALGFGKGTRRSELWSEKVFASESKSIQASQMHATEWGVLNEAAAVEKYKSITGHDVSFLGFAVHSEQRLDWVAASPDGLISCSPVPGILEVKCPYNKGRHDWTLPWLTMPFHYMPQIQGQMEIMDRDWVDLYCWTLNGSSIFRVPRDREYWELIHGVLREFWWENVIPAREALLVGGEEAATVYKPAPKHRLTGLVVSKSIKLASEATLVCQEIGGRVDFFT